ncbi:Clp protease N-terminal domain-containing protein [Kitasatospora sp. NPDC058965]|uniref:Clp protease N-terminal domain-containing protein n=1 Tax=Kitasatospora sp. NPDC058965 TaxID=3346682 RepID=UPI0036A0B5A7
MPKINVYLSDELAEAVRAAGLSVSPICQRALEQAVRRVTAIREVVAHDLESVDRAGNLARFTERARTVLKLAAERAQAEQAPNISTAHLLTGLLAEGGNLALQVLGALEITPAQLTARLTETAAGDEPGSSADGELRVSGPAAEVLELTVAEAAGLGHNYVGCEHLLLGLVAESQGTGGRVLREAGAEQRLARRAVAAALAGYGHLRATHLVQPAAGADLAALLQRELQPLIARIEQLEARLPQ